MNRRLDELEVLCQTLQAEVSTLRGRRMTSIGSGGNTQIIVLDDNADPDPDVDYAALIFRPTVGDPDTYTLEFNRP